MKNLLTLLLTLILCLGVLIACDAPEESSSSSSSDVLEPSSAKELDFYNGYTPSREESKTYYNFLYDRGALGYLRESNIFEGNFNSQLDLPEWYIVDTYEEYKTIIFDDGALSSVDFEDNIVAIRYGPGGGSFYNFRIEDNVAHIDYDSFNWESDTYIPALQISFNVIVIPRTDVDTMDFDRTKVIESRVTGGLILESWWYEREELAYNDGDTWLIDEQEDWDALKPFLGIERSSELTFEDYMYIVVYREISSAYTYGYCFPKFSEDGKEMIIECSETQNLFDTQNAKKSEGYYLIRIRRYRLPDGGIAQDAKAKIVIKPFEYKYSKAY